MIPALSFLAPLASQLVGSVAGGGVAAPTGTTTSAPADFGAVLTQVANDTMSKLHNGETAAVSGIEGKASVQDVVKTVLDAQTSLQTALAIRDKLVSAYQEVSRMSI